MSRVAVSANLLSSSSPPGRILLDFTFSSVVPERYDATFPDTGRDGRVTTQTTTRETRSPFPSPGRPRVVQLGGNVRWRVWSPKPSGATVEFFNFGAGSNFCADPKPPRFGVTGNSLANMAGVCHPNAPGPQNVVGVWRFLAKSRDLNSSPPSVYF